MYNLGMLRTVGRMKSEKKTDHDIINELCRLYSLGYKKAKEIVNYFDNIKEV